MPFKGPQFFRNGGSSFTYVFQQALHIGFDGVEYRAAVTREAAEGDVSICALNGRGAGSDFLENSYCAVVLHILASRTAKCVVVSHMCDEI